MNWKNLTTLEQLDALARDEQVHVIFKHSTRCPVSTMAKKSLELDKDRLPNQACIHYLDLIAHRDVSNAIAARWHVVHESPQILIVKGTVCLFHASHEDIDMSDIIPFLV